MRIISLTFLIQLRFSSRKSITGIICTRYDSNTLKELRQFVKFHYQGCKSKIDVEFLELCQKKCLILKFLCLKLANSDHCYSNTKKKKAKLKF